MNLDITEGECWHLLGNNGSGKSSLLALMAGTLAADTGQILLRGRIIDDISLAQLAQARCFLQQLPQAEFDISLQELLTFYSQQTHLPKPVEDALGLSDLMPKSLRKLSGGQQQRFHIALSLTQIWPAIESGKALVLLDEPYQYLDISYQCKLKALLKNILALNNTIVMSTHDVNSCFGLASHIAWLKDNAIMAQGSTHSHLSTHNMTLAYGHAFHEIHDDVQKQRYFIHSPA
ncbi:ATP-binding cassette domain-containing protein [Glaciecola sp. 2405UD65-10]|uniref:ATP-binding cassette domain-containing protein n=1 Tax=Glaciecola sp. 2405UD65-10 TaxID=3397244 RepID=UPI003B5CA34A